MPSLLLAPLREHSVGLHWLAWKLSRWHIELLFSARRSYEQTCVFDVDDIVDILKTSSQRPGRKLCIRSLVIPVRAWSESNRPVVFITRIMFFNDSRTDSRYERDKCIRRTSMNTRDSILTSISVWSDFKYLSMKSKIVNQRAVNVGNVSRGDKCWRKIRERSCETRTRVSSIPCKWSVMLVVSNNFNSKGKRTLLKTDSHSVGERIWSSGRRTLRWR